MAAERVAPMGQCFFVLYFYKAAAAMRHIMEAGQIHEYVLRSINYFTMQASQLVVP